MYFLTEKTSSAFQDIRREYGYNSLERVERMMSSTNLDRHPMQKSAKYILPGISKTPWQNPYAYSELQPIVKQLEDHHLEIKHEYTQLWDDSASAITNYKHYLMTRADWKAFYVFRHGSLTEEAPTLTPVTYSIVSEYGVKTGTLCPLLECHFSTLQPGAVIPQHCDLWNFTINLHLAVDIPTGCGIRVAGEERVWQEGKCLLFDYSFLHEAWNRSERCRTCLLMDLWHPEVTIAERQALLVLISEIRQLMDEAQTE
jgi:aspartyl/asparaginyl beta-hydroxylase (cupin superfamily)